MPPTLDGFRVLYGRTPAVVRGIAFMVAATLLFASMQACIRGLSEDMHPFLMVFFRNLFGLRAKKISDSARNHIDSERLPDSIRKLSDPVQNIPHSLRHMRGAVRNLPDPSRTLPDSV